MDGFASFDRLNAYLMEAMLEYCCIERVRQYMSVIDFSNVSFETSERHFDSYKAISHI